MHLATKLFCCAICATLPLALHAAPVKAGSSKAPSVKATPAKATKIGKHKLKSKRGVVKKTVTKQNATKAVTAQALVPRLTLSPATPNVAYTDVPRPTPAAAPSAPVSRANPYLAIQYAQAATNPYLAAPAVAPQVVLADNPYLAKPSALAQPAAPSPWSQPPVAPVVMAPAMAVPPVVPSPTAATGSFGAPAVAGGNPYLASQSGSGAVSRETAMPAFAKLDPLQDLNALFNSVRNGIPVLNGQDLLPTVKTVYPTGEKPLVILSFKCPTEMLGVTPPPMKALHEIVNYAFDGINKTNLLSFNMQQVCQ